MTVNKSRLIPIISVAVSILLAIAVLIAIGSLRRQRELLAAEKAITPAPTLAPPTLYARPTDALIRTGSIGPEVEQLQQRLKQLGYYEGGLDGQFGSGTRAAVERFQAQHGLRSDGMAGEETLAALYAASAQTMAPQPTPPPPAP